MESNIFKKIKLIGILLLILTILIVLGVLSNNISVETAQKWVSSFGVLSPVILIILCTASTVLSPLVVTLFWIASIKLFGFWPSLIYIAIANIIGHSSNFWIARKWGRPVVRKLVGKKGLREIDSFSQVIGKKVLIFLRIVGGPAADYISYAAGFTSMRFPAFAVITIVFMKPWTIFSFWMTYKAVEAEEITSTVGYFVTLAILTILITFTISMIFRRGKRISNI
ncbi:MAG: VTT domain-containing protein [Candidatus Dojkabacteria bacterium]|nr:VTT domain-containing protein [Candidatus Dojkabacteria bacterium]